jgi:hypothetical protein
MDLPSEEKERFLFITKYKKHITAVVVILVCILIVYNLEGYVNAPPGLAGKQIRSDPASDKQWNLEQFEKSVALLNSKTN